MLPCSIPLSQSELLTLLYYIALRVKCLCLFNLIFYVGYDAARDCIISLSNRLPDDVNGDAGDVQHIC